ncbi:hypothetical protein KM043_007004 [Ampulex compressa]|nr:hypothetical protein KM043_007004 [Ampulex compressa]
MDYGQFWNLNVFNSSKYYLAIGKINVPLGANSEDKKSVEKVILVMSQLHFRLSQGDLYGATKVENDDLLFFSVTLIHIQFSATVHETGMACVLINTCPSGT